MENNRYFTLQTEERERFFKIPKAFMDENSRYFKMSAMAKMLYGILSDRNSLSIKKWWYDEHNRVYFLFAQETMCNILGVKDPKTVRKLLVELENVSLLYRKKQGNRMADRLYLLQVEVEKEESLPKVIGKKSLYRQGKNPYADREKFPPNETESETDINETEISSSDEEDLRDKKLKSILQLCQKVSLKLKTDEADLLLEEPDFIKIKQIILTCKGKEIKKPYSYITNSLINNSIPKQTVINKPVENKFNNFKGREYDYDSLEKKLLGWED